MNPPRPKVEADPQRSLDADAAHHALDVILADRARLNALIGICANAWADLDHHQRRKVAAVAPRLVDALLASKGR